MTNPTPITAADNHDDDLARIIIEGIKSIGDAPAREHLAAGRPIYTWEEGTPEGLVIKTHPGGRRELVRHYRDEDKIVGSL